MAVDSQQRFNCSYKKRYLGIVPKKQVLANDLIRHVCMCSVTKETWFTSDIGLQWSESSVKDDNWFQAMMGLAAEDKKLRPIACKMTCYLIKTSNGVEILAITRSIDSVLVGNNINNWLCTFTKRSGNGLAHGLTRWSAKSDTKFMYVCDNGFMPSEMEWNLQGGLQLSKRRGKKKEKEANYKRDFK